MSLNIYEIFNSHIIFDKIDILEKIEHLKKELKKKEESHVSYHNSKYSIHYSESTFSELDNKPFQIDIIYNSGKNISYIKSEKQFETFALRYYDEDPRMVNCNLKIQQHINLQGLHKHFDFFAENDLRFKISFNSSALLIYPNEAEPITYDINKDSYDNIENILISFLRFDLDKTSDYIDLYNINTDVNLSSINKILTFITEKNNDFIIKNTTKDKPYSPINIIKKLMGKR